VMTIRMKKSRKRINGGSCTENKHRRRALLSNYSVVTTAVTARRKILTRRATYSREGLPASNRPMSFGT
jgi:hypothetical protein